MKDLEQRLSEARAKYDAMTPAEKVAMHEAQRQSFLRSLAPCEHGVSDWEDCEQCRDRALQAQQEKV